MAAQHPEMGLSRGQGHERGRREAESWQKMRQGFPCCGAVWWCRRGHDKEPADRALCVSCRCYEKGSTRALASGQQGCRCHALASWATSVGALFPQKSAAALPCRVHILHAASVANAQDAEPASEQLDKRRDGQRVPLL